MRHYFVPHQEASFSHFFFSEAGTACTKCSIASSVCSGSPWLCSRTRCYSRWLNGSAQEVKLPRDITNKSTEMHMLQDALEFAPGRLNTPPPQVDAAVTKHLSDAHVNRFRYSELHLTLNCKCLGWRKPGERPALNVFRHFILGDSLCRVSSDASLRSDFPGVSLHAKFTRVFSTASFVSAGRSRNSILLGSAECLRVIGVDLCSRLKCV